MTKLAFQAAIPRELFEDSTDCLHRVVKPMLASLREQMRERGELPAQIRISIMIDEVPDESQDIAPDRIMPTISQEVNRNIKRASAAAPDYVIIPGDGQSH